MQHSTDSGPEGGSLVEGGGGREGGPRGSGLSSQPVEMEAARDGSAAPQPALPQLFGGPTAAGAAGQQGQLGGGPVSGSEGVSSSVLPDAPPDSALEDTAAQRPVEHGAPHPAGPEEAGGGSTLPPAAQPQQPQQEPRYGQLGGLPGRGGGSQGSLEGGQAQSSGLDDVMQQLSDAVDDMLRSPDAVTSRPRPAAAQCSRVLAAPHVTGTHRSSLPAAIKTHGRPVLLHPARGAGAHTRWKTSPGWNRCCTAHSIARSESCANGRQKNLVRSQAGGGEPPGREMWGGAGRPPRSAALPGAQRARLLREQVAHALLLPSLFQMGLLSPSCTRPLTSVSSTGTRMCRLTSTWASSSPADSSVLCGPSCTGGGCAAEVEGAPCGQATPSRRLGRECGCCSQPARLCRVGRPLQTEARAVVLSGRPPAL